MSSTAWTSSRRPNDTININFGFTRSWFQTPNSYDMQSPTAWSGWWSITAASAPTARWSAPPISARKIRTFNIAPNWTRAHRRQQGAHVRRMGAAGSIQLLSEPRSVRRFDSRSATADRGTEPHADQRRRPADLSYSKGIHNIKVGAIYQHTFLTEKDSLGIVDPDFQSRVFECGRQSLHRRRAHQSGGLHRAAFG